MFLETSLVARCLGICCTMQGMRVRCLVGEDLTCHSWVCTSWRNQGVHKPPEHLCGPWHPMASEYEVVPVQKTVRSFLPRRLGKGVQRTVDPSVWRRAGGHGAGQSRGTGSRGTWNRTWSRGTWSGGHKAGGHGAGHRAGGHRAGGHKAGQHGAGGHGAVRQRVSCCEGQCDWPEA